MITERTCITIVNNEGTMTVIDVLDDYGAPTNPWGVLIDTIGPDGQVMEDGPAAGCHDFCLDDCNGDTLASFWIDYVLDNNHA